MTVASAALVIESYRNSVSGLAERTLGTKRLPLEQQVHVIVRFEPGSV